MAGFFTDLKAANEIGWLLIRLGQGVHKNVFTVKLQKQTGAGTMADFWVDAEAPDASAAMASALDMAVQWNKRNATLAALPVKRTKATAGVGPLAGVPDKHLRLLHKAIEDNYLAVKTHGTRSRD